MAMIVDAIELPELPGLPEPAEDPRLLHDAASLYLARALDGRGTERNARLAGNALLSVLDHPLVAGWPLARSYVRHDLAVAHLLAAEVASGEREVRILRSAVDHLEAARRDGPTGWPPRHRGRLLHNLGYALERLADLEANEEAALAGARARGRARGVYVLAGRSAHA